MAVLRAVARPMVASIFIIQGFDTFRRPERVAAAAEPVVRPLAERVPAVPAKAEQAVRLNGAVQMTAGVMLALGRWPRMTTSFGFASGDNLGASSAAATAATGCAAWLPLGGSTGAASATTGSGTASAGVA